MLFHELKDALTGTAAQELKEEDFCDCDGDDGVSGKDALSRSDSEAEETVSADGSSSDDESGNELGPHLAMEEDEDLDGEVAASELDTNPEAALEKTRFSASENMNVSMTEVTLNLM